ncbi:MAG: efflux RND transporter permease subunit [Gammaproteobacteria bacterium]|nr:MAG: efflux RND transporter permease subunit [Gammaproteobacteria bacterium]
MGLLRACLGNPVAVVVGCLLALLFGTLSLTRLPVQLTPEVEEPEITITTAWRAAAPEEVEAEILEPQEDALRGLPGLTRLEATASRGQAQIVARFAVGTDLRRALVEILGRLNQVSGYPEDAEEPVISSMGADSRPIAWFIVKPLPGNHRPIDSYQDFLEDVVQTRFERVPGVARSEVRGGRGRELRITFDPYKLAALGIELPKAAALAGGAGDVTAGFLDLGRRRYTVRLAGDYGPEGLRDLILAWRDGRPVRLGDVAQVAVTLQDRDAFVIQNGEPAMAVNAHREIGVNVLRVMAGLQEAARELREGPLKRAGLSFQQVYDETQYIRRAIAMLEGNLGLGILLAVAVLWWFVRRLRATLLVALAIPLSLVTSFVFLEAFGRTLNVISLAGLALAVGMVLDAAIVVVENIVRLREQGADPAAAALEGTAQVWPALLASTATTVAIFLPVVFLRDEAGQLFADLALGIAAAVSLSLVLAVTVVPTAARAWLGRGALRDPHTRWWDRLTRGVMAATGSPLRRALWIGGLLAGAAGATWALLPKADYLPEGNRNLVFAFILPPPGTNIDTLEREMGRVVARRMAPYLAGERQPRVRDYFFVAFGRGAFMGARAVDPARTGELVGVVNRVLQGFPDTIAFARRASLFGGLGAGRSIDMDLQAREVPRLLEAARAAFGLVHRALPGASVRPLPGLSLAQPELRLLPDERRLREAGWDRATLGRVARALGDGLLVGDHFDGRERLDVILRARPWRTPEALAALPLATPGAGVVPLGELARPVRTAGPEQIRRIDRRRTVTLRISPPEGLSLAEALERLRREVAPKVAPLLPEDGEIRYTGTADKLRTALASMSGSFLLAVAILYLLMSALFRSFRDSLLVLLTLPLATVGGVVALRLVNRFVFQPMDLLTMIGFVILLGLVVNNAILLVHQTRSAERAGLGRREAVAQAVRLRLRPILMTTLTSIFGMLPLLLVPGAGTELYRGMAAVIVGGMAVSTAFTLLLLPALLRLGEGRPGAKAPSTA